MTSRQRVTAFVVVLGLVAIAAYLPAVHSAWVWDDADLVKPSPALVNFDGLVRAVSTDLYRQANARLEASVYWRPLALASFWFDSHFGPVPTVLHMGNVALHALAAALLTVVILRQPSPERRSRTNWAALFVPAAAATAWWALHPEHVEAVAWISGRYDVLSAVALLGLLALPSGSSAGNAALQGLLVLAGMLSKDGFVPMLFVPLTRDWVERKAPPAKVRTLVAMVLAVALWVVARAALSIPGGSVPSPATLAASFLDTVRIYFLRAVMPPALTTGHVYVQSAFGMAVGALVIAGLVFVAVKLRPLAVPVVIFLAGLLPVAAYLSKDTLASERYLYVPSLGLALLLGELLKGSFNSTPRLARWVPIGIGLVTLVGLIRVEARIPAWRSDDALFAAALRVNPSDPLANLHAGIEAGRRRDWGEARRLLDTAARGDPHSGRIASAYAWVLLHRGDAEGAAKQATIATQALPSLPDAWLYLARARHLKNDHAGEVAALEKLLNLSPNFPGAIQALATAVSETELPAQGPSLIKANDVQPMAASTPQALFEQARAHHQENDHKAELAALDELMRIAPDVPGALAAHTLAANEVLLDRGDVAAAIAHAQRVTELAPSLPEAWSVLAFARHVGGDHAGELSAIDRLRAVAPDFPGIDRVRAMAACEASGGKDCTPESLPNTDEPR